MKKLISATFILTALLLAVAPFAFAAEDSASVTVSWAVNAQQSLRISSNGATSNSSSKSVESVYEIPQPTDSQLERGFVREKNALELEAASNVDWEVKVEAQDEFMDSNTDYDKPVSDLSVQGMDGFNAVSHQQPTTIASGQAGERTIGVDYKVSYDEEKYVEGSYEVNLVYTISVA
ncbi:MAG: hypothetical protein ACOCZX_02045 [Candidatus Bipolaricaulota bacterium]